MTTEVYTFGYAGKKIEELQRIVQELDAIVFDVRFSPRSRNPAWNKENLETVLGPRYRHVRALGNRNYRGGPIEIVDMAAGIQEILNAPFSVVLMCVCSDPQVCHRTFVGDHLRTLNFEVQELNEAPPTQLKLM